MASATADYFATPLEDNLFEWHFTVRGPESTDFEVRRGGGHKNCKFSNLLFCHPAPRPFILTYYVQCTHTLVGTGMQQISSIASLLFYYKKKIY